MTGRISYHAGLAAEEIVMADYMRRGHDMAAKRWRGSVGEVDLILRDGDQLVFVEVKKSRSFELAAGRLSRRQRDRICATASEFVAHEPRGQLTDMRFDLAMVNSIGAVQVIENAFMDGW